MSNKSRISFEDFQEQFERLVKDKEEISPQGDHHYKNVELYTFGDQKSGVRVAEILNEFRDAKYRKKALKFLHFSIRCYQEIEKIKERRIRVHLANVLHTERKKALHSLELPPVLRNHMYAYIIGKYRNIVNNKSTK